MRIRLSKIVFWTMLLIAGAAILGAFTVVGMDHGHRFWSMIAVGVVLGSFAGLCLFLKPKSQPLALVYFSALLIAVFAAEFYLDGPPRNRPLTTEKKLDQLLKVRAENRLAVPFIPPNNFLSKTLTDRPVLRQVVQELGGNVPISGVPNRTTVYCSEKKGVWAIYESDRHGFNNPDRAWDAATEIVAVGDSFAHGACVPAGKGMVDLVREQFPGTINLGMAGNGPLLMLATIREFASILRPHIVLWFFYEGNDLSNLPREIASSPHRSYLDPAFRQDLLQSQPAIDASLSIAVEQLIVRAKQKGGGQRKKRRWGQRIMNGLLLRNLRTALLVGPGDRAKETTKRINLLRKILTVADAEVAAWGGRLCFVYLPSWEALFQPNNELKGQRQETLDAVTSLGIPVIDIQPTMAKLVETGQGEAIFYDPQSHYSEFGHATVAQELLAPGKERLLACGDR